MSYNDDIKRINQVNGLIRKKTKDLVSSQITAQKRLKLGQEIKELKNELNQLITKINSYHK